MDEGDAELSEELTDFEYEAGQTPAPKRRRWSVASVGAVALSLLLHGAALAVVLRLAGWNALPTLSIQGGSGSTEFGVNTAGGDGPRDQSSDLPGDSAAGHDVTAPPTPPLPEMATDLPDPVRRHEATDLLDSNPPPLLPTLDPPPLDLARMLPRSGRPVIRVAADAATGDASTTARAGDASPGAVSDAGASAPQGNASDGAPSPNGGQEHGVGGAGGHGAGGGAGRAGIGGPTAMAGNKPPVYPPSEFRNGITGTVKLRVVVLEDGRAGDVSVFETSTHGALDRAAVDAVRDWRWSPMIEKGAFVRVSVIMPIRFEIRDQARR